MNDPTVACFFREVLVDDGVDLLELLELLCIVCGGSIVLKGIKKGTQLDVRVLSDLILGVVLVAGDHAYLVHQVITGQQSLDGLLEEAELLLLGGANLLIL
jgi:hypothetical protein